MARNDADMDTVDMLPSRESGPSGTQDIIALIVNREGELSKTNQRIAKAILSDPRTFVQKPVEELIEWLGVSAPTITRFARSFDCEGLRDLKLKVMGSMRVGMRYLEPQTPPQQLSEVASRVINRAHRAISQIEASIDLNQAEKAIAAISECRTLYAAAAFHPGWSRKFKTASSASGSRSSPVSTIRCR
jgi:DNA-binding MurR/RpiR family transcriptional regulator